MHDTFSLFVFASAAQRKRHELNSVEFLWIDIAGEAEELFNF